MVLIDSQRRPLVMVVRGERGSSVVIRPLIMDPETSVQAAVRRAITRPERTRNLPLVCTDERGQLVGWVPLASLVARLADLDPHRADPHRADPHRADPHRADPNIRRVAETLMGAP